MGLRKRQEFSWRSWKRTWSRGGIVFEKENIKEIVVETYALLAIVYDVVGGNAKKVLEAICGGEIKDLIPVTVAYEYIIHWLRGRIPGLKSIEEVTTYLKNFLK